MSFWSDSVYSNPAWLRNTRYHYVPYNDPIEGLELLVKAFTLDTSPFTSERLILIMKLINDLAIKEKVALENNEYALAAKYINLITKLRQLDT